MRWQCFPAVVCLILPSVISEVAAAPDRTVFRVDVVDEQNGFPVPLVELETTHGLLFVTDNAGVAAIDAPELMDTSVWFFVRSHGYSVAPDGFGYRGVRLTPRPGERATVRIRRDQPAVRLGRLTGGGLLAESMQLSTSLRSESEAPASSKSVGVLGCDSVQIAEHRGRLVWNWGDTTLPGYPLGRFHMTGAATPLFPLQDMSPQEIRPPFSIPFRYFQRDDGSPRNLAKMPGDGPTWLTGYVSLPDEDGNARLGAVYQKIQPPLTEYERGLCVWNDETEQFEHLRTLWKKTSDSARPVPAPSGHAVFFQNAEGEQTVLFGDPFPTMQCRAAFEAWQNPDEWKPIIPPEGAVTNNGTLIRPHRGSVAWNSYRGRWVTIFTQQFGKPSAFGEVWYAESESPFGPWEHAVKVATHDDYSFYNPIVHTQLIRPDSKILLFEGTYAKTFSGRKTGTPRYDYNQVMYRLDLDHPELPGGSDQQPE